MGDETGGEPPEVAAAGDAGAGQAAPVEAREERYRTPIQAWAILAVLAVAGIGLAFTGGDPAVLMEEDFEGGRSDWVEAADAGGSLAIRDGVYHMTVVSEGEYQSYSSFRDVGSLRFDADATMESGKGGLALMCLSEIEQADTAGDSLEANADYYGFFVLFQDGGYAIFRTGTSEPLAIARDRGLRSATGPRHVTARCSAGDGLGATVSLSVDGREVVQAVDGTGPDRFVGVGLAVLSYGGRAEATFDNVKVVET